MVLNKHDLQYSYQCSVGIFLYADNESLYRAFSLTVFNTEDWFNRPILVSLQSVNKLYND